MPSVNTISMPSTLVEGVITRYSEPLICTADLGYPGGQSRILKLETKKDGEAEFHPFDLKNAEEGSPSEGSCQLSTSIMFREITFTGSYNGSVLRCSVYEDESSSPPLATSDEVPLMLLRSMYS